MMERYEISLEGETFVVEIIGDPTRDEVEVRVDGEILRVRVGGVGGAEVPADRSAPSSSAAPLAPAGPRPVTARAINGSQFASPLPGTIISVAVQAGQHVDAGDELLVIEAMKMNNRIRSPRSGTIGEILVQVGQQVNHGVPLLAWSD